MCTVTWTHQLEGYDLLCNRDELHTRGAALPPAVRERNGVTFIAPLDSDFGGTWISVNQFGLSLCLLNGNSGTTIGSPKPLDFSVTSRGLLVLDLIDSRTSIEVAARVAACDLRQYRPFTIVVLAPAERSTWRPASGEAEDQHGNKPGSVSIEAAPRLATGEPLLIEWTGAACCIQAGRQIAAPLVSSSFDAAKVAAARHQLFARSARSSEIDVELLRRFHASHEPARGPLSPCMHREDAATVSFSWIRVRGRRIEFLYLPHSPCEASRDVPFFNRPRPAEQPVQT